jgi:hypothetical protein
VLPTAVVMPLTSARRGPELCSPIG